MLWAYVDETGLDPSAKMMTVAGLVADAAAWEKIQGPWMRALPSSLTMFHARDLVRGLNGCRGLKQSYRVARYDRLSTIAAQHNLHVVSGSLDLAAWRAKRADGEFDARFPTPYSFCFELCLKAINEWAQLNFQEVSLRYAIQDQFLSRAKYIADACAASKHYAEFIVDCAPDRPQQSTPLQVADMICYEIYSQNQGFPLVVPPHKQLVNKLRPATLGLYHDAESLKAVMDKGPSGFIS